MAGRLTLVARWRSCARTGPTSRHCWPARIRRCPSRAAPKRSARSTRRTPRGDERADGVAQARGAEADLVAVLERRAVDPRAVEEGAVAAAVVEQDGLAVAVDDQRVAAGDRHVLEFDVGGDGASDPGHTVMDGDHAVVAGDVQGRWHGSKVPLDPEPRLRGTCEFYVLMSGMPARARITPARWTGWRRSCRKK